MNLIIILQQSESNSWLEILDYVFTFGKTIHFYDETFCKVVVACHAVVSCASMHTWNPETLQIAPENK